MTSCAVGYSPGTRRYASHVVRKTYSNVHVCVRISSKLSSDFDMCSAMHYSLLFPVGFYFYLNFESGRLHTELFKDGKHIEWLLLQKRK